MRVKRLLVFAAVCSCEMVGGCGRLDQAVLLGKVRARYYNMASAGVKGFACQVTPDWNTFIASVGGHPEKNTPWHIYLSQVHLSFQQPLRDDASVQWVQAAPPPANMQDLASRLKASLTDMLQSFLGAWQPSLNGTLLPTLPVNDIVPQGDGYQLVMQSAPNETTIIHFDKKYVIRHIAVHGPRTIAEMNTTYRDTPKGLVLVQTDSLTTTSPSKPAIHSVVDTTFADVDGVSIPSSMDLRLGSGTHIPMQFAPCRLTR